MLLQYSIPFSLFCVFVLVPCGPGNFHTSVNCSTGVLKLTWDQTYGANGYSASLISVSSGRQHFCNSTYPSCSHSTLACGDSYVAQVRSYNGTCFSMFSQPMTIKEGQWALLCSVTVYCIYKGIYDIHNYRQKLFFQYYITSSDDQLC